VPSRHGVLISKPTREPPSQRSWSSARSNPGSVPPRLRSWARHREVGPGEVGSMLFFSLNRPNNRDRIQRHRRASAIS
jgi:hypothetical protein